MAMKEIITKKLYKNKYPTMEQYFKEVFKLSRASVYRFVDASRVLTVILIKKINDNKKKKFFL